jgi:deazaflavin-dependent oxidoreductase (nitroreductase family)
VTPAPETTAILAVTETTACPPATAILAVTETTACPPATAILAVTETTACPPATAILAVTETTACPPATAFPPLPPTPDQVGMAGTLSRASQTAFRWANRCAVVPLHRAGLAVWMGNPLTGWQLLLTTTGRKSGLRRRTPLGYLIADGAAWVMAGYGSSTLWYRNLLADPAVDALLPARPPFAADATDILDPIVRARIIPRLVRSMALPGTMIGCLPWSAPDERILELTAWLPLIRLSPAAGPALVAGPDDPGGLGWTWRTLVATLATLAAFRALRGRPRP